MSHDQPENPSGSRAGRSEPVWIFLQLLSLTCGTTAPTGKTPCSQKRELIHACGSIVQAVLSCVGLRLSAGVSDFARHRWRTTTPPPTTEPANQRTEFGHAPIMRLCAALSEYFAKPS